MTSYRNNPPGGQRALRRDTYLIPDPGALGDLIDAMVLLWYKGRTNLAATSVRRRISDYCRQHRELRFASLSQPQLHRLRNGQRQRIREANLWGLLFLPPDDADHVDAELFQRELLRRVVPPEVQDQIRRDSKHFKHRSLAQSPTRDAVLKAMQGIAPTAFREFDKVVRQRGHDPETVELALDRVVEPFVQAARTGNLDRAWNELAAPGEQRVYTTLALRREGVLLNRPSNLQRAQQRFVDQAGVDRAQKPKKGRNSVLAALAESDAEKRRWLLAHWSQTDNGTEQVRRVLRRRTVGR